MTKNKRSPSLTKRRKEALAELKPVPYPWSVAKLYHSRRPCEAEIVAAIEFLMEKMGPPNPNGQ
jgi:hypothetical protein